MNSAEPQSEQEIVAHFQRLLEERDQLTQAQIEQQQKVSEHDLVIRTLEPLEGGRKCFSLVGEVLVERTVGDVLPNVKSNRQNLATLVTQYEKRLEAKQKEVLAFQERHNIRIKGDDGEGPGGPPGGAPSGAAKGGQGVLVGS